MIDQLCELRLFWQIKTIGDGQASVMIGNRKRHGNLTIVLLAELAAILPRNPDRMPPLLGESCVIDDPSFDWAVPHDSRQDHLANFGQDLLVTPVAFTDKMQQ